MENGGVSKKNTGVPPKLCVFDEVKEGIDKYFEGCDTNPIVIKKLTTKGEIQGTTVRPYTVAGLAHELKVNQSTLYRYANGDITNASHDICELIRDAFRKILRQTMELGLVGVVDSRLAQFVMTIDFKYGEKEEDKGGSQSRRQEILKKRLEEARRNIEKSKAPEKDENGQ